MSRRLPVQQVEPERLARLPVYAQDEINQSRRRIEELTAELDALVAPDNAVSTHADPHADRPKPVGDYPSLRHRMADGTEVNLDLLPHKIHLWTSGASHWYTPVMSPSSGNAWDIVVLDSRNWPQDPRPQSRDPWRVQR